jgi:hypothetical protein
LCHRAGQALYEVQGERNWLIARAKMSALGQCEARYRRIPRVLRVTTAATLSSLMRKMLQTWADYLDKLRTGAEIIPIKRGRIRSTGRTPTIDKMR